MTPKQKAQELWNNIVDPIYGGDGGLPYSVAKETILKCVDEILKANPSYIDEATPDNPYGERVLNIKFWQQVKEELQKM